MKKAIFAAIGACITAVVLMACGGKAHAADINLVKNTSSTAAYGQGLATSVDKVVNNGNYAAVTYLGQTSPQLIQDDASWTKYTAALNAAKARGAQQVGTSDRWIVTPFAIFTDCYNGDSRSWFPVQNNPLTVNSDGCAFRDKANGNSN